MPQKVTNEKLIAYASGELTEDQLQCMELYLTTHPKARHLVEQYMHVAKITSVDDSTAASATAISRAKSIWQESPAIAHSWMVAINAFVAELVFDSKLQRATVRGAARTRDLEFRSSVFDIDVRLEHSPLDEEMPWVLSGQVEFHDGKKHQATISVRRSDSGDEIINTVSDDQGYFSLKGMPDQLVVLLGVDEQWTHLPGIDLS